MRPVLFIAAIIFAIDRFSKWWVLDRLGLPDLGVVDVAPPFLRLVMAWNKGVNFGIFASDSVWSKVFLAGFALVVCVVMALWAARRRGDRLFAAGAGVMIGGALGNAYDRLAYGAVADFINMSCCGITNPFAFNIADIGIFAGLGLIVVATWRDDHSQPQDKTH